MIRPQDPPWLHGLVWDENPDGTLVCPHLRPLSLCCTCAPEAERRKADYKAKQVAKREER